MPTQPVAECKPPDGIPTEYKNAENEIDLVLLKESLEKTVWERMLANDDALHLADLLQAAVQKIRAKS